MALFDKSAVTYDQWCSTPLGGYVDRLEKQMLTELANPKPGESVIDLGCGTGIYSILFARQGLTVTGIDASGEMLNHARNKAAAQSLDIEFLQGDLLSLPFPDNRFDLAICNVVLEFVSDPRRVLEEGLRVLRPGGRLIAGLIGKQSDWARNYEKRGQENPDSVFSQARFYTLEDIRRFSDRQPSQIRFGLYVSPAEFVSAEQAAELEQRRIGQQAAEAGFLAVRWDK
jgi:ubiquinone/menaquinone biosynthesis C-methylase UbiE